MLGLVLLRGRAGRHAATRELDSLNAPRRRRDRLRPGAARWSRASRARARRSPPACSSASTARRPRATRSCSRCPRSCSAGCSSCARSASGGGAGRGADRDRHAARVRRRLRVDRVPAALPRVALDGRLRRLPRRAGHARARLHGGRRDRRSGRPSLAPAVVGLPLRYPCWWSSCGSCRRSSLRESLRRAGLAVDQLARARSGSSAVASSMTSLKSRIARSLPAPQLTTSCSPSRVRMTSSPSSPRSVSPSVSFGPSTSRARERPQVVVARAAGRRVAAAVGEDRVVAGTAALGVVAEAARHHVVAALAVGRRRCPARRAGGRCRRRRCSVSLPGPPKRRSGGRGRRRCGTSPVSVSSPRVAPEPSGPAGPGSCRCRALPNRRSSPGPPLIVVVAAEAANDVVPRLAVDLVGELGSTQPVVPRRPGDGRREGGRGEQRTDREGRALDRRDTRLKQWGMGPTS